MRRCTRHAAATARSNSEGIVHPRGILDSLFVPLTFRFMMGHSRRKQGLRDNNACPEALIKVASATDTKGGTEDEERKRPGGYHCGVARYLGRRSPRGARQVHRASTGRARVL